MGQNGYLSASDNDNDTIMDVIHDVPFSAHPQCNKVESRL